MAPARTYRGHVDRRLFLTSVAAMVATGLAGCDREATGAAAPTATPRIFGAPQGLTKVALPHGTLYQLPGKTNQIALTVDDGTNAAVVEGYARLCRDTGLRLTFFCNGVNRSWTEHAGLLRPLHDDNQIFLANHTWSHASLVKLSAQQIADQVQRNEAFLKKTYGTLGRPFMRPPYGYTNDRVAARLTDLGYPAQTMWLGTLGDSSAVQPATVVASAEKWLRPGRIVIGHANHPAVTKVYGQLVEIIRSRKLVPVHLGDVYAV
ncbi:polysaccharide deacetylase [Intrasporangium oryzae NRRL B-24470]|uniref:Polysaccharide deacetylase n=1 Tax=Intrasporangium oryzae NRRL B-24470 TaxID=1386089 RepID=W9G4Q0_9MICO|nr:polysaccharide deacetylase [Intrasporangium oryzae NRRL B-24470]